MSPGQADKKPETSYLGSAVNSINPWASSRTMATNEVNASEQTKPGAPVNPDDHSVTHMYGQSFKTYPPDCPPLKVQWFHAVDVPKYKPQPTVPSRSAAQPAPPLGQPKKFSPFSVSDSKALENEYQKLLEKSEVIQVPGFGDARLSSRKRKADTSSQSDSDPQSYPERASDIGNKVHVPVNEDFLFDVKIETRELAPVFWLGPVYEVRRGTWFYQDGSNLRPCEENLAAQLEEGYLKLKPWLYSGRARSASSASKTVSPKASQESLKAVTASSSSVTFNPLSTSSSTVNQKQVSSQPQTYRLFGTYMNNIATYHDSSTVWLSSDGVLSWVTSSVYERFAGGGYMSGVKLTRGYTEPSRAKDTDNTAPYTTTKNNPNIDERQQRLQNPQASEGDHPWLGAPRTSSSDPGEPNLQRQLSLLMESDQKSKAGTEEEIRMREEQEIQDDYNAPLGETQGREIEHLVLVTHGIGQLLSLRMESVNFVHDVNILRKTMKSVYANSASLKALNSELGTGPGNSHVQVLPVCWRHLLDFPRRERKREHDLGDVIDEDDYPSLEDITVEGMTFARSLISDLALDVLLYQSSYRKEIAQIVSKECNHIFKLFKTRNPGFKGKVHLLGHSLGSAILFDILCEQAGVVEGHEDSIRFRSTQQRLRTSTKDSDLQLNFEVENLFCLGSPIGLFQMLKGRTIASRQPTHATESNESLQVDLMNEELRIATSISDTGPISSITDISNSISSPKVGQLYNIFHPSDPISYRLEPLISPSMSALKPQLIPYTKKGIFGTVAPQGLTGIGARVGQSMSGLWSSLSAGIASNILNRSLRLNTEEVARITEGSLQDNQIPKPGSRGAIVNTKSSEEITDERKVLPTDSTVILNSRAEEVETLFSKFQQRRAGINDTGTDTDSRNNDQKARKLRAEDNKVRALNRNGRVDYSIQESVLDFNPINTIASHISYWGDEDVSNFIISQVLKG